MKDKLIEKFERENNLSTLKATLKFNTPKDVLNFIEWLIQEQDKTINEVLSGYENFIFFLADCSIGAYDCRMKAMAIKDNGKAMDYIKMRFPVIQGFRNQQIIRQLGKNKYNQEKIKKAINTLKNKHERS